MNRTAIWQISVCILIAFVLIVLTIALMPIWFTVGMIKPSLFSTPSTFVTQKMTRQMIRGMMGSGK